jgi:hypothetical protein
MLREEIILRLQRLEADIEETIRRLPAHSVKPPVMMDLLALEDEREVLKQRLAELEKAFAMPTSSHCL